MIKNFKFVYSECFRNKRKRNDCFNGKITIKEGGALKKERYEEQGIRIRRLREERKMSQKELANKVSISSSYLSEIEHGRKSPDLQIIALLAKNLGTTTLYLTSGSVPSPIDEKILELLSLLPESDKAKLFACIEALVEYNNLKNG